jgi:hypothetical protein
MAGTAIRIAYIDDVQEDLSEYSKRLSRVKGIAVRGFPPRADLQQLLAEIEAYDPDLDLVDIRLQLVQSSGEVASYGGSGLGSELRTKHPDRPIVLIANPRTPPPPVLVALDGMLYKDEVAKDPESTVVHLRTLALGYRRLRRATARDAKSLFGAMGAREAEEVELAAAGPPLGTPRATERVEAGEPREAPSEWGVADAARWIRGVVLRYPGIVYDDVHAATALGLDVRSFLRDDVQQRLSSACYTGAFAPSEGRWWRGRLMALAAGLMKQAGVTAPIIGGFRDAFNRETGARLHPSVCVYSGEKPADRVCYLLRQPVMRQYSLIYNPDDRPAVMDQARVSFKAALEDNRFRRALLTAEGREVLESIRPEAQP